MAFHSQLKQIFDDMVVAQKIVESSQKAKFTQARELLDKSIASLSELSNTISASLTHVVNFLIALCYFYKIDLPGVQADQLLQQALASSEKAFLSHGHATSKILSHDRADIICLQGLIEKEMAQRSSSLQTKERLFTSAADKFLKAMELGQLAARNSTDTTSESLLPYVHRELVQCQEFISNGPKSRQRVGNCVFFIGGVLQKEGFNHKNYKTRWLVIDDSGVLYYEDKAQWEEKAKSAKTEMPKPKGTIPWSSVLDVTAHPDLSKCVNVGDRFPKGAKGGCLHFLTMDRTYNVVGFSDEKSHQEFVEACKYAFNLFSVKKRMKEYFRSSKIDPSTGNGPLPSPFSLILDVSNNSNNSNNNNNVDLTTSRSPNTSQIHVKPFVSTRLIEQSSPTNNSKSPITYKEFKEKVEQMQQSEIDSLALALVEKLKTHWNDDLEELEEKLHVSGAEKESKTFLLNACNISNFQIARFGGLYTAQELLLR